MISGAKIRLSAETANEKRVFLNGDSPLSGQGMVIIKVRTCARDGRPTTGHNIIKGTRARAKDSMKIG